MKNDHLDSYVGRGKTTTPQHTPIPWRYDPQAVLIETMDGVQIATACGLLHTPTDTIDERMEFIVRAVNSYDENQRTIAVLVEALEEAVGFAGSMYRIFSDPNFTDRYDDAGRSARTRDYLRVALAAAKGTSSGYAIYDFA